MLVTHNEEIKNLKQALKKQGMQLTARPILEEVTRKAILSPRANKLYGKIIKMKRDKRRLKRLVDLHKKRHKTESVQLRLRNHKDNDTTAHVRQQLVDMIVRNNDKAPQV